VRLGGGWRGGGEGSSTCDILVSHYSHIAAKNSILSYNNESKCNIYRRVSAEVGNAIQNCSVAILPRFRKF
jgi:hypothetical protein